MGGVGRGWAGLGGVGRGWAGLGGVGRGWAGLGGVGRGWAGLGGVGRGWAGLGGVGRGWAGLGGVGRGWAGLGGVGRGWAGLGGVGWGWARLDGVLVVYCFVVSGAKRKLGGIAGTAQEHKSSIPKFYMIDKVEIRGREDGGMDEGMVGGKDRGRRKQTLKMSPVTILKYPLSP